MRLAALTVVVLCACNTTGRQRIEWDIFGTKSLPATALRWRAGEKAFVARTAGFEAAVPAGWERDIREKDVLLVTRDGPSLQRIQVGSSTVGRPLGIGYGPRPVSAGMTPADLADLAVEDVRATYADVHVVERGTATLTDREAVRVVVSYVDGEGLRRRAAFCGVLEGERAYYAVYFAPERYYFALDLPVFEEVARSVRLRPAARAPGASD
jgi:hypothetical protein